MQTLIEKYESLDEHGKDSLLQAAVSNLICFGLIIIITLVGLFLINP